MTILRVGTEDMVYELDVYGNRVRRDFGPWTKLTSFCFVPGDRGRTHIILYTEDREAAHVSAPVLGLTTAPSSP